MRTISVPFNFMRPEATGGVVDDAQPENTRLEMVSHDVTVHDLRGHESNVSLETHGFAVMRHESVCRDPRDEGEVLRVYYPEVEALIQKLTGATVVKAYGHIVRASTLDGTPAMRTPARIAHVDNDFNTTRQLAARLAPSEQQAQLMQGRFMLINVWRPLRTVERHPLAVADGSTVCRKDLVPVRLMASRAGVNDPHGLNMIHSDAHRWYYLSKMQPDEWLAFRQIDAKSDAVQFSGHSSFEDPETSENSRQRESIEIRTVSYMPW